MTTKKPAIVVVDQETYLKDLEGNDALLQSQEEIKGQVQRHATASLPTLYARAMAIVKHSKNEKVTLEAMKFIKSLSDGETIAKTVNRAAKKFSDSELLEELDGEIVDHN